MTTHWGTGAPGLMGHPLAYVRHERGWTYQDLVEVIARRLNTAARREKAWRWENRGVVPDGDTQLALAAELGVPAIQVHALGWPDWLPVGENIAIDAPWTLEGSVRLLRGTAGAAVLDRRGFLILGAGTAAAVAEDWLTIESPPLASVRGGGQVDPGLVTCLEQRLPGLRHLDATLGGGHIRGLVDSELRLVTDLLANASYPEPIGQRLLSVAAELGRVAGWASFDAGYQGAAQRYWVGALHAAHAADDRGIGANILKCMSLQSLDNDRPDEALVLAGRALVGARDEPARVKAMLTVRLARTYAVRGETRDCEEHLSSAEAPMNRATDEDTPTWAAYFDSAEYCAQVAACYLLLHRHQAADHWLTQSLQLQPDERSRDRATYLIWRADSVLELGEVEHACALVGQAVPDITAARSVRNQRRLTDLHTKLAQHHNLAAVQELDEQIRSLITPSADRRAS